MPGLALVHVSRGRLRVVNVDDIYMLESDGGDTLVHRRAAEPLRDGRRLGDVLDAWADHPLVRIHEGYAVHPIHVLELRRRETGRDWELRLEPPLNTVLPISRSYLDGLWEVFGA